MPYDAIVLGLGGMGSAAAYHLAGRGKRVLGLERFTPPHEWGSSHGRSRIIRQAYYEDPAYVPLLFRAYELWEKLEGDSAEEILTTTGGLMIGAPESALILGSTASAEAHDIPYDLLDDSDVKKRFPVLSPEPGTVALYEEKAGFVRPEAAISAHLNLAARHDADLHFGEPVVEWRADSSGDRVEVVTEKDTYEAERLVITAGAWAPELLADLGLPLEVTRQVLFWFEPRSGVESFHPESYPIFIWEPEDGNTFYSISAHDGERGVKVAFYRADGVACTPETIVREVGESEAQLLRRYLSRYVPDLDGRLLQAQACMYTNTPDLHFVISPHPRHAQVVLATGFSGHGYKFCPVVGEILADLVTEGSTRHPTDLFSPTRSFEPTPEE